ncbi:putative mitochondrial hypothetical protein [Leptomonas pyrrhocoris]|uniref:Uncharacterized protein n=1 Tax=Leptomonas pyrrhocoris TaxID=157538 RepID=A0A0M9FR09_LEPPY|nr:putative mitochondrial hypothetical protein [Leptomonas pyrrhocoris]KPA74223.1 putative mitochondrial hypothetical protein [Leptomonas pyrrhocoris]|eukprot:XP_015652662.1 putative mitochondrial hypothetical protein [Leptomonas pyrrhocoris]
MSSSIHVILVGTDAFRVEGALQGTMVHTHKAWNKSYQFSCTSALSVDKVDKRLLLVCHVIILCKGCRSPANKSSYSNRVVLALPDATPSCIKEVEDGAFYYGVCALEELKTKALTIGLAPPHVIYDAHFSRFTEVGEAAFKRAFWLLDRDADGLLRLPELVGWRKQVEPTDFSAEEDMVSFLSDWGGAVATEKQADLKAFLDLHLGWLTRGSTMEAWATLHASGIHPDGLPYSWYDLHSIRVDRESNTYLSGHAIQFFTNVYKLKRFAETADIWAVTPGCPWASVDGFLQERIPMVKYVEYWKYMALARREDVIRYARYMGYKGEISYLFTRRSARAYRTPDETVPNTIHVLVVGAAHSGRRSLMYALTSSGGDAYQKSDLRSATCVRTTTFFAAKGRDEAEEAQTLVYTTVAPEESQYILADPERSKTYDVVLLCYDGADITTSGAYVMGLFDAVCATEGCERMPFVVVMTKADAVRPEVDDQAAEAGTRLQNYCLAHQLLWPPVITSSEQPDQSEASSLNQYMYAVTSDPTLAVGQPPLTYVRIVRRATFVAILAVAVAGAAQTLVSYIRRRRR